MTDMTRRSFLTFAGTGLAAFGLAACGGNNNASTGSAATTAAASTAAATASGEGFKIGILQLTQHEALDASHDELYLVGDLPEGDELLTKLKEYVRTVRVINPVEEYGESPLTLTKGIPYDLMTLFAKEQ
jgi:hypothetical protein